MAGVPVSVAQQTFAFGSAAAAAFAGLSLARDMEGIDEVPTSALAGATLMSAGLTFLAAILLGRAARAAGGQ